MLKSQLLDDLTGKIRQMVDSSPSVDLKRNIYALLQGAFTKMELISREEFDVQADVLGRTRAKLESLEKKLQELEEKLQKSNKTARTKGKSA